MGGLLDDYSLQAKAYDSTRAASPCVLEPLRNALAGAPGRRLADIGGGTGNYAAALAAEGWESTVVDRSAAMLERAAGKRLGTLEADAQSLPLEDASFDAAMLISMLHHVDDVGAALREAWRVLAPGGRLAAMVFAWEDVEDLWPLEYFPSSRSWMEATHPPLARVLDELPGGERTEIVFTDLEDGSLAATVGRPDLILDPARRSQISFFERMQRDHPEELAAGLARLQSEFEAGQAPTQPGVASLLRWAKPP